MSIKGDLAQLDKLSEIRQMRVERAQKALAAAKEQYDEACREAHEASKEVEQYASKMPGLIEELWQTCIGIAVGKTVVEDARAKEGKIRTKYVSLREAEREAKEHQKAMKVAVEAAHTELIREEHRKDGLGEITNMYKDVAKVEEKRQDGRVLDEFATVQAAVK